VCCVFVLKDEEEKKRPKDLEKIAFTLSSGPNKHMTREVLKNRSPCRKCKKMKDENNNWNHHPIPHKNKNEEMVRKYNKTGKYSKKNKYKEWKDDDDDDGDLSDLSFDDDYEDDGSNARKQKRTAVVDESKLTARQRAKLGQSTGFDESLMSLDYGDKRGGILGNSSTSRRKRMKMTEEEIAKAEAEEILKKEHNLKMSKEYNKRKKKEKREAIMAKMFQATVKRGDKEEQQIKDAAEQRLKEKRTKRESLFPDQGFIRHISSATKGGSFLVLPVGASSENVFAK
jgi:hypothetical protein